MTTTRKPKTTLDTTSFERREGRAPRPGDYGYWIFETAAGAGVHFSGTWRDAAHRARNQAAVDGSRLIVLLP